MWPKRIQRVSLAATVTATVAAGTPPAMPSRVQVPVLVIAPAIDVNIISISNHTLNMKIIIIITVIIVIIIMIIMNKY